MSSDFYPDSDLEALKYAMSSDLIAQNDLPPLKWASRSDSYLNSDLKACGGAFEIGLMRIHLLFIKNSMTEPLKILNGIFSGFYYVKYCSSAQG